MRCTRREADAELARLRVKLESPPDERPCPTFEEVWREWYAPELGARVEEGSLKPRTSNMYGNLWNKYVGQRWGATKMDDVKPDIYQTWLLGLTKANGTLSDVLVGNLVKCAKLHGVRGIDFKDVSYRVSRAAPNAGIDDVYKLEEMESLCRASQGSICEVPAILAAFGSCRTGEACAALVADVSARETPWGRVVIVRIDKQLDNHRQLIPPKNPQSVRSIIIPEPWATRITEIVDQRTHEGLVYLNDNGCGEPARRTAVSSSWRKVTEEAGLRHLPLTKLRNSWETMMRWVLHIDKDLIDKMMGHTSADVRSKHYDRPDEEQFAETVAEAWNRYRNERR